MKQKLLITCVGGALLLACILFWRSNAASLAPVETAQLFYNAMTARDFELAAGYCRAEIEDLEKNEWGRRLQYNWHAVRELRCLLLFPGSV